MDLSSLNMKKCLPFTKKDLKSVKEILKLKNKEKNLLINKIKNLSSLLKENKMNSKENKKLYKLKETN